MAEESDMAAPALTDDEKKNGWTAARLTAYHIERDRAADLVGGMVATEYQRPKAAPVIENSRNYNPHKWQCR